MSTRTIVVVGSANIDMVAHAPHCVRPGESLIGTSLETVCGGKGANQAVAAARLGARTHFVGCVGDDAFGAMQRRALENAGVDIACLKTHSSEPTGTALICVADTGQNSIVVVPGANLGITPDDIRAADALFAQADAVLLQLEIRLDTVDAALEAARRHGALSILDAGPAQHVPEALIAKADLVSPNETEAEAITGIAVDSLDDAERAAERLIAMGAREAVMKLGARGALYVGQGSIHAPAFVIVPVDTTAAGDAFTAALALEWGAVPRAQALRFANAAGALAAMSPGAQPSMPSRAAVESFRNAKEFEV